MLPSYGEKKPYVTNEIDLRSLPSHQILRTLVVNSHICLCLYIVWRKHLCANETLWIGSLNCFQNVLLVNECLNVASQHLSTSKPCNMEWFICFLCFSTKIFFHRVVATSTCCYCWFMCVIPLGTHPRPCSLLVLLLMFCYYFFCHVSYAFWLIIPLSCLHCGAIQSKFFF